MVKITVSIYPNDYKVSKKTGKTPLYMDVLKGGLKVSKRLAWDLTQSERQNWNNVLQRVEEANSFTNTYIEKLIRKFNQLRTSEFKDINEMSPAEIRDYILGLNTNAKAKWTILEYLDDYMQANIENSTIKAEGTKKNYRKAYNHIVRFIETHNCQQKRITSLDYSFAKSFSDYLMSNDPKTGRQGMVENSALTIIKKFKTIFDQAIDEDLISKNPFKKLKLVYRAPVKPRLSINQLTQLHNCIELTEKERVISRMFILMCLTGCAFNDFNTLSARNIEKHENGNFLLKYNRNKTGLESQQFLTLQAIEILSDFELRPDMQNSNRIVPYISNQHFNRQLKIVGAKARINFDLATHIARHTYRQLLDEADIIDPAVICKHMGWANKNTMDATYRMVTESRLLKSKDQFETFLKNFIS
jgi:site-specific recombinase XerD